jgi:PAS domain S-box-containing protein
MRSSDVIKFGYFNKQTASRSIDEEIDAIIESFYDGIFIADAEGFCIKVNKAYERITGLSRTELIGKNLRWLVSNGYYSESTTLIVKETKKPITILQTLKNGKKILCTGNPILDNYGNLIKVVTNVRDITELTNIYDQLRKTERLKDKYEKEIQHLRKEQLEAADIIAESPSMIEIISDIYKVARVDSSVLILGESGVGKEIIAKLLHKNSKRKEGPFIKINCAAIPHSLLESELFGYEEGAFTGAKKSGKPGVFELADKGTLFLDEIAEIPLELQPTLLRVLQDREIRRIASVKPIKIDSRLVFATNRNLEEMVKEGDFREDLYYRINVVPIIIPPLRERKEDIRPLIFKFLDDFRKKYNIEKTISEAALEKLVNYYWPGNIRELRNVIERLVVVTNQMVISSEHIPSKIINNQYGKGNSNHIKIIPLNEAVENVERDLIWKALRLHKTTRKAAKALGISQSTIVRKCKILGIDISK